MFGTIRKHQTWLWAVIITLTVISFVVYFSPYSRMNSGVSRRSAGHGTINGQVVTDQQYVNAYREVDLHTFLNSGHWLSEDRKRSEMEVERQIYQWLLLTQKQEQYAIHVSEQDSAAMARQIVRTFERMGITSPQMFIERVLQPHGLQVSDLARYVQHYVGVQELITTLGLSGRLVTPQEAQAVYQREHQEVATDAVLFSASNYLAGVLVTPDQVSQFYSNRLATYAIPERVVVEYLKFNVTNYLPRAQTELSTNLNELVEMNYQRMGTNAVPEAKTPEEAKARIREQLLRRQAMADADKQANEFIQKLGAFETNRAENLRLVAQSNNLPVLVSAPFDNQEGPKDLDVGADFVKQAFALTADEPFAGPLVAQDGIYIIGLNKRLPRETPALDSIRDRVVADYKHGQAMLQARQAASTFYTGLTNGLSQGKPFSNLCSVANVKLMALPPFSISTQRLPPLDDFLNLAQLKQAAFSTQPGKASPLIPTAEGFLVLYVKEKLPLDQAKMQQDLPGFTAAVRRSRQQEAFDDWFRREAERGLRDTPIAQPAPPALGSGKAKS